MLLLLLPPQAGEVEAAQPPGSKALPGQGEERHAGPGDDDAVAAAVAAAAVLSSRSRSRSGSSNSKHAGAPVRRRLRLQDDVRGHDHSRGELHRGLAARAGDGARVEREGAAVRRVAVVEVGVISISVVDGGGGAAAGAGRPLRSPCCCCCCERGGIFLSSATRWRRR